jgi:hypothetical protein
MLTTLTYFPPAVYLLFSTLIIAIQFFDYSQGIADLNDWLSLDCIDCVLNSFQAIAPLTAHEKGVHFFGEHISLKNGTICLISHNTSSFKDTCFLIRLEVLPDGLYVLNGQPNMPVPTLFRPLTVERQLGIESGSCNSVWKKI